MRGCNNRKTVVYNRNNLIYNQDIDASCFNRKKVIYNRKNIENELIPNTIEKTLFTIDKMLFTIEKMLFRRDNRDIVIYKRHLQS